MATQILSSGRGARTPSPVITDPEVRRRLAFSWYGGKYSALGWLLPLLPTDAVHYCEPFGGSAAVLLNRAPAPVETYNDLDGDLANFFAVLRTDGDKLMEALELTPFSREEFLVACEPPEGDSAVERARRFYIRAAQVRMGLAQTATVGRWANCKYASRAGMSSAVSRWLGKIEKLPHVVSRLRQVQIENRPALEVIDAYDGPDTLFYVDPPYVHESRATKIAYGYEMSDAEHTALANRLLNAEGRVIISGYRSDLMDRLYKYWERYDAPVTTAHSCKAERSECVWSNFELEPAETK